MELNLEGQKINQVDIVKEIRRSFIDYSASVIVGRALPDVRDGLKPVHRRILYAMYEDKLTYDKPYRKSATTVGNVLGHYHPHGDAAVYDAMVRLAQWFSLRYPLIDGQGNFGNLDGDGAAAYRYTEARMAKMANAMLQDIEKEVVDFIPNFDNKLQEPTVLPSRFPNLLCNGSMGIAVGMATNIPPHNLCEVIDAVVYLMDHPEAEVRDLMQFVKGPDFPTAASIYGTNGIEQAYLTGRGKVLMRAKTHFETHGKRECIVVDEIPYQVNKSDMVGGIADLVKNKRIEGIVDLRDESCKGKIRVVIELRHDANREVILNLLYKYSRLQETFAMNMLALVGGEPKTLSLKDMLRHYLNHQVEVTERRTRFDLNKALARLHILEGYKIAIDNIDEVIRIIRANRTQGEAKAALIQRFSLSDVQGQAIVEMPLGRLAGLEIEKILEEMAEKQALVARLQDILANRDKLYAVLKEEILEIRRKFGDERRTKIEAAADDIVLEDLIEKHAAVITVTHAGYIKRQKLADYQAQNTGGKGMRALTTKEEDSIRDLLVSHSHNYMFFFSNQGRLYVKKCYEIPEASRTAKGTNLVNVLSLKENEKITAFLSVAKINTDEVLSFVTRSGFVKRTPLNLFRHIRKDGVKAITLNEDDELLYVSKTEGAGDLFVASSGGNAVRFHESEIRLMGRTARGVRAMRLGKGEYVCGALAISSQGESRALVTMTDNGVGKRSEFDEFSAKHRGGKGMRCQKLGGKAGSSLIGIQAVEEEDDLMLISSDGKLVRVHAAGISKVGRNSSGIYVMRLEEGETLISIQRVINDEELEAKAENLEETTEELSDEEIPDLPETEEAEDEIEEADDASDEE
ncbi:MAG: DNA gyrase subunit A [Clostridia bacterium]|nr:DNA gyrase subunit A [Clostridia bacterium]